MAGVMCIAFHGKHILELRNITCHMGSLVA